MKKSSLVSITLFAATLTLNASMAHAATDRAKYFSLQPAEIREVTPSMQDVYAESFLDPAVAGKPKFENFDIDWGTMITVGEKVIQLIQASKPVTNIMRDTVSVLPSGTRAWDQLSGWQSPATRVFEVSAKNLYGITVISMRLKISANYGGGIDGRGKYLANVTVVPSQVFVRWGFTADVFAEHHDPVNMGTTQNPIAGLGFDIRYKYGSVMNEESGTMDYFVTGNGDIQVK